MPAQKARSEQAILSSWSPKRCKNAQKYFVATKQNMVTTIKFFFSLSTFKETARKIIKQGASFYVVPKL